ncbi:MAG: hypothetical protein JSV33_03425, partial [bacterium]
VAGGWFHSLGLKSDGRIVAWGRNNKDQCTVPEPNGGFIAVAGGAEHSLGLKSDGTILVWGNNFSGQCNVPEPNEGFIAVAGGMSHSLGLKSPSVTAVEEPEPGNTPRVVSIAIRSLSPNPFNPLTEISFETLVSGCITLDIYDVSGRRIGTVALGSFEPGLHRAVWDGRDGSGEIVSSGVYFLRLRSAVAESQTVKAVLIR